MSDILRLPLFHHFRAEPSVHVLHYQNGKLRRSGRGLAFWYRPRVSGLASLPLDDREQAFHFVGRTLDFQDLNVQGAITFRVVDAEKLAGRVDFSLHVEKGTYLKEPFAQLSAIVTQLAQQVALDYVAHQSLRALLQDGVQALRDRIEQRLRDGEELAGMGLATVSVRLAKIAPTAELERALQAPAREAIQQASDEATFQRRALAVEKERAIGENELQSKIELAKRAEHLILQEGSNQRKKSEEEANARRIEATSKAETERLVAEVDAGVLHTKATAEADAIQKVEGARNEAEAVRLAAYGKLPASVMLGLAIKEVATKLRRIDRLNLGPDALGPMLQDLLAAGTQRLEAK